VLAAQRFSTWLRRNTTDGVLSVAKSNACRLYTIKLLFCGL
jgi:hypothetical protein